MCVYDYFSHEQVVLFMIQKEKEDGKLNLVLLYLKENLELDIENATDCIGKILDKQKKEFLKMTLEDYICVPKQWRQLHLCGLKAFQMFYNSNNGFDSPTALINNINKAFYEPLVTDTWKTTPQQTTLQPHQGSENCNSLVRAHIGKSFQDHGRRRLLYYSNIETSGMRGFPLRFPIVRHSHKFYARVLMPTSVTKPLLWR